MPANRPETGGYQLFMLTLCVYALAVTLMQMLVTLHPEIAQIFDTADYLLCAVFFADFLYSLWTAPDRWRYFSTWGWLDLLSSLPMLDAARFGRLARVLRVVRVLRGLRSARVVAAALLRRKAENSLLAAALAGVLLMVFCSVAILQFEASAPNPNIKTAEQAMWWALTTVTTVGYGDYFPVTSEGRLVAGLLMIAGVGIFSTVAGFLAATFLSPGRKNESSELAELRQSVDELRTAVEKLTAKQ